MVESLEPRTLLAADDPTALAATGQPIGTPTEVAWLGHKFNAAAGSYLLTFDTRLGDAGAKAKAIAAAGALGVPVASVNAIGRGKYAKLDTTGLVTDAAVQRLLASMPGLKAFEPNAVYSTASRFPNDPQFGSQWWHDNTGQVIGAPGVIDADIDTPQAWDLTIGTQDVIIAIIDTGVQLNHPDLAANIWVNPGEIAGNQVDDDGNGFVDDMNGWDFGDLDNDPSDVYGHGTSVAGCVGAVGNNAVGMSGVAWNVSLMALKIADRFGSLQLAAIVGAHDYATMMRERGTNVVASNNSYAGYQSSFYSEAPTGFDSEKDAIQAFIDSGGTFVAAAANDGFNNDDPDVRAFPASYNIPGLIAVAATNNQDALAGFSNYGAQTVDLGAPGELTGTTTINSGYGLVSGTSFASPITAGAVALLASYKPQASAEEIRTALINSADQLPTLQGKTVSGGRLNVRRALDIIGLSGPSVRGVYPGPITGQVDANTGQPVRTAIVTFSEPINSGTLSAAGVQLRRDGADNAFDTGDDTLIPIQSIALSPTDPKVVTITFNLAAFPQQRLPIDRYRLRLSAGTFKDVDGNFLNGDSASGRDEDYIFNVVGVSVDQEPNDTLVTATPTTFNASGKATFTGVTLGNGAFSVLDVDLYRFDMPRGGLIKAEVIAQRLPVPSTLDSYVRLFNATGAELSFNDQYYGSDSYLDFFVTTGGTYYIGVSGFGNDRYSPTIAGSGGTQSTGAYNLSVAVELVADDQITVDDTLDAPLPIPAATGQTQGVTSSFIDVTDNRQILDLDVALTLEHEFDSDLLITLVGPTGVTITLSNRRGGSGMDFTGTLFDDEAAVSIANATAPFTGGLRPDQPLSTFDGLLSGGRWTLVINDTTALHVGQLISWSLTFKLRNNIFGPFESNDTIVTARDLTEISATGIGSATRNAAIGDGGFGVLDRDIFRLNVAGGSTMNAYVTSTSALDGALRLFNAQGVQITVSAPDDSKGAKIEKFVFREPGIYYLAVSEQVNTTYNPFDVTTGVPAVTTGNYTLSVAISAGVSDAAHVLDGSVIDVGVSNAGMFLASDAIGNVGLRYKGVEFLFDPTQNANAGMFYGASASGIGFINQHAGSPNATVGLPVSITDQSDSFNGRVTTRGLFNQLRVERSISLGLSDSFVVIDVTLTNIGGTPLTDVSWMEAFNPSPGLTLFPKGAATFNDVDATRPISTAKFKNNTFEQGLTVALGAASSDARASAGVLSPLQKLRDSAQLLALPSLDPNGTSGDMLLTMAYDLGTLAAAGLPGASATMRYFIFFGDTPAAVETMYTQVNNGTGGGHLTANPGTPASEGLLQPDGSTTVNIPLLPYRVYYPEGYANSQTFTFLPMMNPSDSDTRVVVIARYEFNSGVPAAQRDQVISDFVLKAGTRGGITITTPGMYDAGTLLVAKDKPYALEIRSQTPIAATFSHYDQFILAGGRAAIGESFTTRISTEWTFGEIKKEGTNSDFVLFTNTSDKTIKVTTELFPQGGGKSITFVQTLDAYRRGGWNFNAFPDAQLPQGKYGVRVTADRPIVAALSHYETETGTASGYAGTPSAASLNGVLPEGQLGEGATSERIEVLNAGTTDATVTFSLLLTNGSTYRTQLIVPKKSQSVLDVGELPQFPIGTGYSVLFESTAPVSVSQQSQAFGEGTGAGFADKGYSLWGFGEGFRPPGTGESVTERLRLVNPTAFDSLVEITMRFDNGLGTETFRVNVAARQAVELNVHDLVTGPRRDVLAFYGITIKSAEPIIASMTHYDSYFPGAFATLGTPLGIATPIT